MLIFKMALASINSENQIVPELLKPLGVKMKCEGTRERQIPSAFPAGFGRRCNSIFSKINAKRR